MNVMPTDELIRRVTDICRKNGVNHLKLFGSFATGTATPRSDIAWKVMKDILIKDMGVLDFAQGSPRQVLRQAFQNRIIDSDIWMDILNSRNQLAHDYDGKLAVKEFDNNVGPYYDEFCRFRYTASKYMIEDE